MKFVLAGNFHQYLNWIRTNNFSPLKYHYLADSLMMSGAKNPEVYRVGTWYLNPIRDDVNREEKIRNDPSLRTNQPRAE